MNRQRPIPIRPALTALFWLFLLSAVPAQQDSAVFDLPDIVVQANRIELPFSEQSRSIVILDRETIQQLPVISVAEVLNYIPGLDLRQRGVHGIQADLSIRGSTFDQVLVLVNGIKMIDPQTGHHAMNLPVDLENIERIEVLKGPGARVFGPNAFAGAINIITRIPENTGLGIRLQAGANELGGARVGVALPYSNFRQYFSWSKDFAGGYRYNSDYDLTNVFYQNSFRFVNHELRLMAGHSEREFGANGFYASPEARDQFESIQTTLLALEYRNQGRKWNWKPRFYWRRNQDEYVFVRQNPSIYRNLHISHVLGAEVHGTRFGKLGQTGIGGDLQRVTLRSNNLGHRDRTTAMFFLEHRFLLMAKRLDVTPGLAVNYFSDFGTKAYPGIDLGFDLSTALRLFGNLGYTYRIPTFTDLYYQDPNNLGNPDLEPESALTWEGGLKYLAGRLSVQASYFNRQGRDLIDWTKSQEADPWQPLNFSNLDMSGLDVSAVLSLPAGSGGLAVPDLRLGYTYIDARVLDNEFPFSRYALENLQHQLMLGTTLSWNKWSFSVQFRYLDRVNLPDYSLVDSRLKWGGEGFSAFLEATNLLDESFTGANLVPMPGRWVRGGLRFYLKR